MVSKKKSKAMLVTVGTSLFHSASWEFDEAFVRNKNIQNYKKWLERTDENGEEGPLISPEKRLLATSFNFKKHFETKLLKSLTEIDDWAEYFVSDIQLNDLLRYSAELSTIFELGLHCKNPTENLSDFFSAYEINLITDTIGNPNKPNKQYVAAFHIKSYLEKVLKNNSIE